MQFSYFLIELSAQPVDLFLEFLIVGPKFYLSNCLIGKAGTHNETRVTCGATKVHETSFGENKHTLSICELPSSDHVFNYLFLHAGHLRKSEHVNFVVEVANVANNGIVLHLLHVFGHNDILVAGGCDEDINLRNDAFYTHNTETLHACLQRADRVDLCHIHNCILTAHGSGATLAHVTVTEH
jgi:hypothetical protein